MFECQSCLRQAFRAVVLVHAQHHVGRRLLTSGRTLSATTIPPLAPEDRAPPVSHAGRYSGHISQDAGPTRRDDFQRRHPAPAQAAGKQTTQTTQPSTRTPPSPQPQKSSLSRNLQQELRYLKDPLELAKHVDYTLKQGDEDKAAALVRMSSRAVANIVSWNHVIKHQLQKGKHSKALETYNDLKKRGLKPDSYTYLILLDGLANGAGDNPKALGRALSIYHALNGPNSAAAPSIMHTNAIIKVCSQAHDLDSMWDILSKLPNRGAHAANATTYTTLLNGLRYSATQPSSMQPSSAQIENNAASLEAAIVQGKKVWRTLVERWRAGDLRMDEDLVCAMGRLLMTGSRPRDWDDVFTLVQQTMDVARLTPRLGSAARPGTSQIPREDTTFSSAVPIQQGHGRPRATFAVPSNNTLSLITGTCTKASLKDVAIDYWSLLTDRSTYGIQPDSDNYHTWLRLLRLTCSSGETLETVTQDMPRAGISANPKTFRIALAACARAQKAEKATSDRRAWSHASKLVEHMRSALPDSDPQALAAYMVISTERAEQERGNVRQPRLLKTADPSPPPSAQAPPSSSALDRPLIRKHIVDGPATSGGTAQLAARERASAIYSEALSLLEDALPRIRRILAFGPDSSARRRFTVGSAGRASKAAPAAAGPSFDRTGYAAATRKLFDAVLAAYERLLELHALDASALEAVRGKRAELVQFARMREGRGVFASASSSASSPPSSTSALKAGRGA